MLWLWKLSGGRSSQPWVWTSRRLAFFRCTVLTSLDCSLGVEVGCCCWQVFGGVCISLPFLGSLARRLPVATCACSGTCLRRGGFEFRPRQDPISAPSSSYPLEPEPELICSGNSRESFVLLLRLAVWTWRCGHQRTWRLQLRSCTEFPVQGSRIRDRQP